MAREHLQAVNSVGDTAGGYSPNKFWQRATDTQGHSFDARVVMPQYWREQILQAVEGKQFPYKSSAAFIRDAVWHRLQYIRQELADTHPELGANFEMENIMIEADSLMAEMDKLEGTLERIDKAYAESRRAGNIDAFLRMLGRMESHADSLPEQMRDQVTAKIEMYRRIV